MGVLMGNTIDNNGSFHRPGVRIGQTAGQIDLSPKAAEPRAAGNHQNGHVQLSSSVAVLQRLQDHIEAEPSVNSEKVAAARQAIADGSYQINHEQIASALLTIDKQLP